MYLTTLVAPLITRTLPNAAVATFISCASTNTNCPVLTLQTYVASITYYPATHYVCAEQGTTVWYDAQESSIATLQRQVTITDEAGDVTETVSTYQTLVPVVGTPVIRIPVAASNTTVPTPAIALGNGTFVPLQTALIAGAGNLVRSMVTLTLGIAMAIILRV